MPLGTRSATALRQKVDVAAALHSAPPLLPPAAGDDPLPFLLGVVGIFKNEALGLAEWIRHYKSQGADHIILLDNGSTDAWQEAVAAAGAAGVHVLPAPEKHQQAQHYNTHALPLLAELEVTAVAVVDLDEYLFATGPGETLKTVARSTLSAGTASQFACPWHMFGSSGHAQQPSSVRVGFTWRRGGVDTVDPPVNFKAVALVQHVQRLNVHVHDVWGATAPCPPGLQLNHYPIQSREYFERAKIGRGDAANPAAEALRDWDYFAAYDFKDREDFALRDVALREEGMAAALGQPVNNL